jgi:hypothetical protein
LDLTLINQEVTEKEGKQGNVRRLRKGRVASLKEEGKERSRE